MITINGTKWASNDSEFVDTLFDTKGTAEGFYKRLKNKIIFSDMQNKVIFALVKNNHGSFLVNCAKENKGYFYQYGLGSIYEKMLGVPSGCSDSVDYVNKLSSELI